jgi:hypothetical protein
MARGIMRHGGPVIVILALTWTLPARSDVLPEPSRPAWNEHPAPTPEPPPEKDDVRGALPWIAIALLIIGFGALSRQRRAVARVQEKGG